MSDYNQEEGEITEQTHQNQNEEQGHEIEVNQQGNETIQISQFKQPEYLAKRFDNSPLILTDPMIKDGMKKFVIYTISGSLMPPGSTRRYSDFDSLRDKLQERWPGVYIPNIPEKKVVGNLDNLVIQRRMRLLNAFCLKLSHFKPIFECEEMQLFQSNSPDIAKALDRLPTLSYQDIYSRYKEAYPEYYEAYDLILGKGKLVDFYNFLKKYFHEIVITSIPKKTEELEKLEHLNNGFENYEKGTLFSYADNKEDRLVFINPNNSELAEKILKFKTSLSNPYVLLNDWLEEEKLDIEAMVQALDGLTNLNDALEKLSKKLESIEGSIKTLQAGQKDFKTIFKFKNKEDTLGDLDKEKIETESNIQNLEMIIKLASFNMECYLDIFKEKKLKEYYIHLKMFAELQKNNNLILEDLWNQVKTVLNSLVNK